MSSATPSIGPGVASAARHMLTEAETVHFILEASIERLSARCGFNRTLSCGSWISGLMVDTPMLDSRARMPDGTPLLNRVQGEKCHWRRFYAGRLLTGDALRLDPRGLVRATIGAVFHEITTPEVTSAPGHPGSLEWARAGYFIYQACKHITDLPGPEALGLTRAEYLSELEPLRIAAEGIEGSTYWHAICGAKSAEAIAYRSL